MVILDAQCDIRGLVHRALLLGTRDQNVCIRIDAAIVSGHLLWHAHEPQWVWVHGGVTTWYPSIHDFPRIL